MWGLAQFVYLIFHYALLDLELKIPIDAKKAIARKASELGTFARGLRQIIEKTMLQWQYNARQLADEGVTELVIRPETIDNGDDPVIIREDSTKQKETG